MNFIILCNHQNMYLQQNTHIHRNHQKQFGLGYFTSLAGNCQRNPTRKWCILGQEVGLRCYRNGTTYSLLSRTTFAKLVKLYCRFIAKNWWQWRYMGRHSLIRKCVETIGRTWHMNTLLSKDNTGNALLAESPYTGIHQGHLNESQPRTILMN